MQVDPGTLMQALRSPSGVDTHPVIMQVLLVLTWAMHITFIHLTLGGQALAIYRAIRGGEFGKKLALASVKTAVISLSLGVVLGVAPLLFTQVIYDPGWYAANTLSAWWVIAFVPTVILAYYSTYLFYLLGQRWAWALLPGLALTLLAGYIMHVMSYQALFPDRWVEWYTQGGKTMATSGLTIYASNIFRYLLFILASFFIYGLYLRAYAWYFAPRPDADQKTLEGFAELGKRLALIFGPLAGLSGLVYLGLDGLWANPLAALSYLATLIFGGLALLFGTRGAQDRGVLFALGFSFLMELALSLFREGTRLGRYLSFGYTPYDYPLNLSPYGILFFLGTFVTGIAFFGFLLPLLFRAGRTSTVVEDGQVAAALGKNWRLAWGLLLVWVVVFFALGLGVTLLAPR